MQVSPTIFRCRVLFVLFCCAFLALQMDAQHADFLPSMEASFQQALKNFQGGRFVEASAGFHEIAHHEVVHQRTTAALAMEAKAQYQMGDYEAAVRSTDEMQRRYPASSYNRDAAYTGGIASLMLRKYPVAVRLLSEAAASEDSALAGDAYRVLSKLILEHFNSQEIEGLLRSAKPHVAGMMRLNLARSYLDGGKTAEARLVLELITSPSLPKIFHPDVDAARARARMSRSFAIGVLLPHDEDVSGAIRQLAREVLDGIEFALGGYIPSGGGKIIPSLIVRETGLDTVGIIEKMQGLAATPEVVAIIGPLFNDAARVCAPIAGSARIPMISPTASGNGIASVSEYMFQANPDYSTRGRAMARYAVLVLGHTRVAVLSSSDPKAIARSDAFADEARRLGATVVAYERYGKDTTDLHDQFRALRKAGSRGEPRISFARKISNAELRSILRAGGDPLLVKNARKRKESIEVSRLFGPRGRRIADSLRLPLLTSESFSENLDVPVTTIQSIYVSIANAEEIGVLSPQLQYFNIRAQLLGSDEWNDRSRLDANRRATNGIVFGTDTYVDPTDSAYEVFSHRYALARKSAPTANSLYGYDTMNLILSALGSGDDNRESVLRRLRDTKGFEGVHTMIDFNSTRVNSHVHLLKFADGKISYVTDLTVP